MTNREKLHYEINEFNVLSTFVKNHRQYYIKNGCILVYSNTIFTCGLRHFILRPHAPSKKE